MLSNGELVPFPCHWLFSLQPHEGTYIYRASFDIEPGKPEVTERIVTAMEAKRIRKNIEQCDAFPLFFRYE